MRSRALFLLPELPLSSCWVVLYSYCVVLYSCCLVLYSCCVVLSRVVLVCPLLPRVVTHTVFWSKWIILDSWWKKTLDKTAPVKQKYVRSYHSLLLNKEILIAIMNRTRLRNRFLMDRLTEDKLVYNIQKGFLLLERQRGCYKNLDCKNIIDNKSF